MANRTRALMLTILTLPAFAQKPLSYSSSVQFPSFSRTAVFADFNGDGKLDVVFTPGRTPSGSLQLLLGNGDGTFRTGPAPWNQTDAVAVAASDVNGDGKPDLAVCTATLLTILINQGDGTFRAQGQPLPAACNGALVITDLNHDGKADIYDSGAFIWLGNGDGTFNGPTVYNPPLPRQPVIADFNGDGLPDLADVLAGDLSHQVGVWFNHGGGNFDSTPQLAVNFTTPSGSTNSDSLAAGDFNRDGFADLALLTPTGELRLFLSNGGGTFRPGAQYAFPPGTVGLYAEDMDGDGKLDLVVTNAQILILRGLGDGTFTPHLDFCSGGTLGVPFDLDGNSGALLFGDFNNDGVLDMVDYPQELFINNPTVLLLSGPGVQPVIHRPLGSATFLPGSVSGGELVSMFGEDLGSAACHGLDMEIQFNGFPAGIVYASANQINAQVPWELAGATDVQMVALRNGTPSQPVELTGQSASPGIFTIVPAGTHRPSSPDNPARRGQYATVYATGLGAVTNQPVTGSQSPWEPLAHTTSLPIVSVSGIHAKVTFSGLTPVVIGLYQVNFIVPQGAPAGSAVPVTVTIGGVVSNTVTMTIQ